MTTVNLPTIKTYGNYSSEGYGSHCLQLCVGRVTVYYSYSTIVAFRAGNGLRVRENDWGPTTGKHLNWIDGGDKWSKKARLNKEDFLALFVKEVGPILGLNEN